MLTRLSLFQKILQINSNKFYQKKIGAGPKATQKINFPGNLDRAEVTTMFFIIEEAKETVLDFSKGTIKVL